MTNLKRSFLGAIVYLAVIFVLGQTDYTDQPIINFANYFYVAVLVALPLTLFFPFISRVSVYVPLGLWAGVYLLLLQTLDRRLSTSSNEFSIIALEFILLEAGVWFAHQLALQISHAESFMDALALSAFPNRTRDIDTENERIKIELTRSRRYHRPLSVIIIHMESEDSKGIGEILIKTVQHDLHHRFTFARAGQIIDDNVRQTDIVLRDYKGRFIVLCPETELVSAGLLAKRISQAIEEKINLHILWSAASFPDEALTFDDLLQKAQERLAHSVPIPTEPATVTEPQSLQ